MLSNVSCNNIDSLSGALNNRSKNTWIIKLAWKWNQKWTVNPAGWNKLARVAKAFDWLAAHFLSSQISVIVTDSDDLAAIGETSAVISNQTIGKVVK